MKWVNYPLTPEGVIRAYGDYRNPTLGDTDDVGFAVEGDELTLYWRESGHGYVHGLAKFDTLGELLEWALPECSGRRVLEALVLELSALEGRLKQRNRQIRDLRRQLRR